MRIPVAGWVAPFGDPGINDRSHLPRAFRSVPRPSSPLSAKASTRCPSFALDHKGRPPRGMIQGSPKDLPHGARPPENRRAQGQAPTLSRQRGNPARGRSHEDTSSDGASHRFAPHRATAPQDSKPMPRPVRLGHIHKSALPFNQRQPRNPGRRRGTCPPGRSGTGTKPGLLRASGDLHHPIAGVGASGGERDRTDDLLLAKQALSQLSYTPIPGIRDQETGIRSSDP